ncbi:MAG: sigma 54-interacting transcriptional regulator [Nannocystaceae bacterium]|nr:sigma-54-dependent Fis family transcriptional regulator [Myxococcales bacterium]
MNDAHSEIVRLVREATANLAALERAAADGPTAVRSWAQAHFQALVAIERRLTRSAPQQAASPTPSEGHDPLVRALREFFASPDADDPIGVALAALQQITGARRGFVAIRRADGALEFPSARSLSEVELGDPEIEVSRTILDVAIRGGERPLLIDDASADARFAGHTSVQRLAVRAVLVVPLVHDGRAFGVVYLDNPAETAAFDHRRREAAVAFASAVAPQLWSALERGIGRARASDPRLAQLRRVYDLAGLVGESPAITAVAERLMAVAPTDAPTLITGETGVGKELLAALLHRNSRRARGPLITLRCPSAAAEDLPGRLRAALAQARGGTLVLDELDALTAEHQAILGAELDGERGRGDAARLVSTSRLALKQLDEAGALRAELLYRVCVVEVEVPPLRARARDVEALARHALRDISDRSRTTPVTLRREALARLEHYPWPGNVRELMNVLERAALEAGDAIGPEHLPPRVRDHAVLTPSSGAGLKEAVRAFRRRFVERVMSETGDDHKQAAAVLGVHPKYLYKLLRELREDE